MEKIQYKDYFLPNSCSKLEESTNLINNLTDKTDSFEFRELGKLPLRVISRIIKSLENMTGPLLMWWISDREKALPPKWRRIIDYLVQEKFCTELRIYQTYFDEPKIYRAGLEISPRANKITDGRYSEFAGGYGSSLNFEELIAKSIGEFLERYSFYVYQEKDYEKKSVRELKKRRIPFLDTKRLSQPSQEQKEGKPRLNYDQESQFLWGRGKSLFSGKEIAIPAQLIFWNYSHNHEKWNEPIIRESNTNGGGGHYTLEGAILSGLYELIERDGFFVYWFNHQAPPRIDADSTDYQPLKDLLDECRRLKFDVYFLNTTTDIGIPSCVCCVVDNTGVGPKAAIGGGCGMNWEEILLKSLIEALCVFNSERTRLDESKIDLNETEIKPDYIPFDDWTLDRNRKLDILANGKNFHFFQFFLAGHTQSIADLKKMNRQFASNKREHDFVVDIFRSFNRADYRVYYYQAQNKLLDTMNYFAVKVIVPALVHLNLNEPLANLGSERISEVPLKLGFHPAEKINTFPHAFP